MGFVHPALYWLIIGVLLFFLELALPGFILFFFALGALATALVAWLTPISIAWQLAIFMIGSLLSLLALRNLIQRRLFSAPPAGEVADEDVATAVAGDRGVVSQAIHPPAEGRIRYAGSSWRATAGEPIEEGEIIAVVSQKGLVIEVEKV